MQKAHAELLLLAEQSLCIWTIPRYREVFDLEKWQGVVMALLVRLARFPRLASTTIIDDDQRHLERFFVVVREAKPHAGLFRG